MYIDLENSSISVTNSIMKYFNLKPYHNTLKELDILLEKKKYKNVVLLVLDGLGSLNLNDHLSKKDFLRRHKIKDISTVFPPTTTAATTSLLTGLTPSEHNWYGWDMYFKDTNETISLYLNKIKDTNEEPLKKVTDKPYMQFKSIVDLINEQKNGHAYFAYPFVKDNPCLNIDEVLERIEKLCQTKEKKFIYAYTEKPDSLMHKFGIYSKEVHEEIKNLNDKIENLSKKLQDTLIIVLADHGLIRTKFITLKSDYPDFYNLLERTTSIEPRALGLKLKENVSSKKLEDLYNKYFQNTFKLLTVDEVMEDIC